MAEDPLLAGAGAAHESLAPWDKARARWDLGKDANHPAVKLECSCGFTLGRLTGWGDGQFGELVGVDRNKRDARAAGRRSSSVVADVGMVHPDGVLEDSVQAERRQRITCPARSCGRQWLFRRSTLATTFRSAVETGRRSLQLGVDL